MTVWEFWQVNNSGNFALRRHLFCGPRKETVMFTRINQLQMDLPKNTNPDPAAAASVQELMGGRFGEMSTLNNYMH